MSGGLAGLGPSLLDVADRVWPVLLFLAFIQVVADLCDEAGLFAVGAHLAARVAGGSRLLLFGLFVVLATVCTWVLSIDTTAVLLAPIGLALAQELRLSPLPFAFAAIWLVFLAFPIIGVAESEVPVAAKVGAWLCILGFAVANVLGYSRRRSTWLCLAVMVGLGTVAGLDAADDPVGATQDPAWLAASFTAMNALPIEWVAPVDISNAILFLVSDDARYVTGVQLPVDAGSVIK